MSRNLSIQSKLKVCAKNVLMWVKLKNPKEVEFWTGVVRSHLASEDAKGLVMNVGLDKLVKKAIAVGGEYACANGYFK